MTDTSEDLKRKIAHRIYQNRNKPQLDRTAQTDWEEAEAIAKSSLRRTLFYLNQPLIGAEHRLEGALAWLKQAAFLEILAVVGNFGLVIAVLTYLGTEKQRRDVEISNAWQTITNATGQPGSGGRIQALEFLNASPRNNEIQYPGANWRRRAICLWMCTWAAENLDSIDLAVEKISEGSSNFESHSSEGKSHHAKIVGVYLREVQLPQAKLRGAQLANADLANANLEMADLVNANLVGANLAEANFTNANLVGAVLSFSSLTDAQLAGTNLSGAYLDGANLSVSNPDRDETYLGFANLKAAKLNYANLAGVNLLAANLAEAYLWRANLSGAYLGGVNLAGADLEEANLTRARLEAAVPGYPPECLSQFNSDLNRADSDLNRADMEVTDQGSLPRCLDHIGTDLSSPNLVPAFLGLPIRIRVDLRCAKLQGADLSFANLEGADLRGANLERANLAYANLTDANIAGANLANVHLCRTRLPAGVIIDPNRDCP